MDARGCLVAELGDAVRTDAASLEPTRTDKSGWTAQGSPVAYVEARTIEDVQATMRIASRFQVPIVPRGTGTGLAGGANGTPGAIVLGVARMNRILEISAVDELAVVEPGVINADLNEALAPYGLWFAPDPASKSISSVGGNIATNAGGLLCAKYGVTRQAVLALKVVLPDGRLISTGHRTVKGVTGYDLTSLFVGSEGTLGVVVEATVRVLPRPQGEVTTIGASFPDIVSAARACADIVAAGTRPAVLELLDAPSVERTRRYLGDTAFDEALGTRAVDGSYLVVQFDAGTGVAAAGRVHEIVSSHGGHAAVSTDEAHGERLLELRRAFHPALEADGRVLIEDVAVPRSRLGEMFAAIDEISGRYGVPIPTVAHAGDGNLHPNFVFAGEEVPGQVWAAASAMFSKALALGGTLTGEHGVGVLKQRWLRDELGDDVYELQRGIKAVFDPAGIMNPGKVFAEPLRVGGSPAGGFGSRGRR